MKYTAGILLITFTLFGCVTAPMDPNLASQDPEEAKKDNITCERIFSRIKNTKEGLLHG